LDNLNGLLEDEEGVAEPSTDGDGWIPIPISVVMQMFGLQQNGKPATTARPSFSQQNGNSGGSTGISNGQSSFSPTVRKI